MNVIFLIVGVMFLLLSVLAVYRRLGWKQVAAMLAVAASNLFGSGYFDRLL